MSVLFCPQRRHSDCECEGCWRSDVPGYRQRVSLFILFEYYSALCTQYNVLLLLKKLDFFRKKTLQCQSESAMDSTELWECLGPV